MKAIQKITDLLFMTRDFIKVMAGTDYFHQPDRLGNYFRDGRSYYIDFRNKLNWNGDHINGLPTLYFPVVNKSILFPGMILQYGFGSVDTFFERSEKTLLAKVSLVCNWIITHFLAEGYLDNYFSQLHGDVGYYSNNSAMTQGELISFLVRVIKYKLVEQDVARLSEIIYEAHSNLLLPLEKGGAALYKNDSLYFCEYCRKDDHVVLNGWIFAIFGLFDYYRFSGEKDSILERTLDTLENELDRYLLRGDNWSYYDNKQRYSSPVYQFTHINQFDALYRLTGREAFREATILLQRGYNRLNRMKYTAIKIADKLKDTIPYSTSR